MGRKPDAGKSQITFRPHKTNCCTTRLHGPNPTNAAPIAAADASRLAAMSPTANRVNFPSREIRALATERLPAMGRINDSTITIGTRLGSANSRLAGQASKETNAARQAEVSSDNQ